MGPLWRATIERLCARWNRPRSLGEMGEAQAARFLRRRGYTIVARGTRDSVGEIDLIAVRQRTIVFVEVKTRRSARDEHPAEAVDLRKQQRLAHCALRFLKQRDLLEYPARFDVVAITWPPSARLPEIEHIENAFEPPGVGQWFR